jgi:hypothetical protein
MGDIASLIYSKTNENKKYLSDHSVACVLSLVHGAVEDPKILNREQADLVLPFTLNFEFKIFVILANFLLNFIEYKKN